VHALVNARVFTGTEWLTGHALLLQDGRIAALVPEDGLPPAAARQDLGGRLLAPGFIDLQVNGGGGVLFNDAPAPETIARIGAAHRRFGTTGFLATLITTDRAAMAQAREAAREALRIGMPGLLGLHFEGPHLNPARKGIHDVRHMRPMEDDDQALLIPAGTGHTLVTLAPEGVPIERIRALVEAGVRVSAGHTDATYDQLQAAIDAGLSGFTHLFNAMSQLSAREPGAVGTALADPQCWCGIILDGHHVHEASARIAWQAKAKGKLFLVTDAMPPAGTDATSFVLGGRKIEVRGGRCTSADGVLAGSALDMASAVRNAVRQVGIPLEDALAMASLVPAQFLGIEHERGRIAPGLQADLVLLDDDLRVSATWIGGDVAWVERPRA
jgi:N-acetylglucosamine-6-phosphate deacetylase